MRPTIVPCQDLANELACNPAAQRIMGRRKPDGDVAEATRALTRFLSGRRPRSVERALQVRGSHYTRLNSNDVFGSRQAGDMTVNPLSVRTLALLGIDARAMAVAVFTYGLPPCRLAVGDVGVIGVVRVDDDRVKPLRLAIEIGIAPGCRWIPSLGLLEMEGRLPESLLMGMEGRPLRQLVSHHLLDRLELTVETAFDDNGTTTVHMPFTGEQCPVSTIQPMEPAA